MEKAIVFDMDGVIFDTERVGKQAWRQAAQEMNFTEVETAIEQVRGFNGADTTAYFAEHYPEFNYAKFHDRNHEIMLEIFEKEGMPIKTGAMEILTWLKEQEEWKVALATSTGRAFTMHHLEAAGMTDLFDAIVTGDEVQEGKPNPEIYLTACKKLDAIPGITFAIEDSPNGIESAFRAKMRVIMVPDLVRPNLAMREKVVTVQKDLNGVMEFLQKFV